MFRDLLIHVDGTDAARGRLGAAADIATRLGARLGGLHVTPPAELPPIHKPSLISKIEYDISERLHLQARRAAALFSQAPNAHGRWTESAGDIAKGICQAARYADLVIIGQSECQGYPEAHPLAVAHDVIVRCGRAVLVLPEAISRCTLDRVALAWDGSREAVRAIHDALPLLRLPKSILILKAARSFTSEEERDLANLSDTLRNHDVNTVHGFGQDQCCADVELVRDIQEGAYDLIVMGGYSHPRWSEFLFGGVTISVLFSAKTPVFISH